MRGCLEVTKLMMIFAEEEPFGIDLSGADLFTGRYAVSFSDLVSSIVSGDFSKAGRYIYELAYNAALFDIESSKALFIRLLLIGILATCFQIFSDAFKAEWTKETAGFITRTILAGILNTVALFTLDIAKSALADYCDFSTVIFPSCAAIISASGATSTSLAFYGIGMLLIKIVERVYILILIPATKIYFYVIMLNSISSKKLFSNLAKLIKTVVVWINRAVLALVVGINLFKGMITPIDDALKVGALNKVIGAIPGVGGVTTGLSGVLLGSASIIRNSIGVAALVIFAIMAIVPITRMLIYHLSLRLASIVLEPVLASEYTDGVNEACDGIALLTAIVFNGGILFFITISMTCCMVSYSFT